VARRSMANATGAIIELSNYLEQRISQKSAEFAAVRCIDLKFGILHSDHCIRIRLSGDFIF
jgi:hypothetical protein